MTPFDFADVPVRQIAPGFHACYVHGEGLTLGRVDIDAGAELPEHSHEHEQMTLGLSGTLELVVSGTLHRLGPGQGITIAPHERHGGRAVTACQVIDVFSAGAGGPSLAEAAGAAGAAEAAGAVVRRQIPVCVSNELAILQDWSPKTPSRPFRA